MRDYRRFARKLVLAFYEDIQNIDMLAGMMYGAWHRVMTMEQAKHYIEQAIKEETDES